MLGPAAARAETNRRFGFLATAIAGRRLEIERVERLAQPFCDGAVIFVPAALGAERCRPLVALQAGLVAGGSLAPEIARRLRRRDTPRYLALEGHRVCRDLERRFVGLAPELRAAVEARPLTDSAEASLAWARGRRGVPPASPLFGGLRPGALTRRAGEGTPGGLSLQTDAPAEERESRLSGLVDGRLAEWTRRLLGIERGAGTTAAGARAGGHPFLPGEARKGVPGPGRRPFVQVSLATPRAGPATRRAARLSRQPEFDVRSGSYRPDWCTVFELEPGERAGIGELHVAEAGLRRRLARVGLSLRRERRQRDGDDLDLDAVVSRIVDARAHAELEADERIYVGLRRLARSFSVLLLIDASGSTSDPGPSGRPILALQSDAGARLVQTFASLGVPVAAYSFRSQGRHAVELERLLSFLEHSPTAGIERLMRLKGSGFTRLGAAVRHASTVLFEEAGTRERLLIVLSDGFAFDIDYQGDYAEADARRALEEARARGVACSCLTLGSSESDAALRRVFGSAAHASAGRFSDLVARLPDLLRHALAEGRSRSRAVGATA